MAKQRTLCGIAGVKWDENGWFLGASTPCFFCLEEVGDTAIYWAGHAITFNSAGVSGTPWDMLGSPLLVLHPGCAVALARELLEDAAHAPRPVQRANGASPRGRGGNRSVGH